MINMNKIPQKGGWVGSKKILSAGAEPVVRTYISPAIRPRSVSAAKPLFLYQKSSILPFSPQITPRLALGSPTKRSGPRLGE